MLGTIFDVIFEIIFEGLKRVFSKKKGFRVVQKDEMVIDVRTHEEYARGHFPKSISIPLSQIETVSLQYDKNKKILVCCASGARSERAKQKLHSLGFQSVENVGSWMCLK
jgi:phage shock protein E